MAPIIVTGASGSMGRIAAKELAQEGVPVILACRNLERGRKLMDEILAAVPDARLELLQLDLESEAGVRSFVDALQGRPLAGIFNNAGTMCRHYSLAPDGREKTMTVNFFMPALLTRLLLPQFEPGARIVNMVSLSLKFSSLSLEDLNVGEKDFGQIRTYGKSKLALLLWTVALARHYPQFRVNVADPGIVDSKMIRMDRWFDPLTDILFRPFANTPEKGVRPALAALHSDASLRYFVGRRSPEIPSKYLRNPLAEQLWDLV